MAPLIILATVIRDSPIRSQIAMFGSIQSVAPSLGVELRPIDTRDGGEIERAISALAGEPNGGLIVALGARVLLHRNLVVTLAARHRLPAVYPDRAFVAAGGLISYGSDQVDQMRRGRLRRSHSQGREAGRSPGASADKVRADHQSQDSEDAWPRSA